MDKNYSSIAFQGMAGSYSDLACRKVYPDLKTLPCVSFDSVFQAVMKKKADLAMIPVDNTIAGRVADVHHLIPNGDLYIIGEHFQLIRHCLLGLQSAVIDNLTDVRSHVHAIPQCRNFIRKLNLNIHICSDTAKGAADIKKLNDKSQAAIGSELAAKIYGLQILKKDIQNTGHNTTRFIILSRNNYIPENRADNKYLTSIVFDIKNIPAALYKALGGFATNNVQMIKLESYVDKYFNVARFYADVEGHIEDQSLKLAFEELHFFAKSVIMLGTYKAHPFRAANSKLRLKSM